MKTLAPWICAFVFAVAHLLIVVGTLMHGLIGFGVGMFFSLLKSLIARRFQG